MGLVDFEELVRFRQLGNIQRLNRFLKDEIGQPGPQYGGDLAPGISPLQQQAFDQAEEFFDTDFGLDAEGQAALQRLLSGEVAEGAGEVDLQAGEVAFRNDPKLQEEFFKANVQDPALKNFNENLLPGIDQRFAARGVSNSGGRFAELGNAANDVGSQLTRGRTDLAFRRLDLENQSREQAFDRRANANENALTRRTNARESALERLGPAIAQALGIERFNLGVDLAKFGTAAELGSVQRGIEGDLLADDFRRFQEAQPVFNPALGLFAGATSASPGVVPGIEVQKPHSGEFLLGTAQGLLSPPSPFGGQK